MKVNDKVRFNFYIPGYHIRKDEIGSIVSIENGKYTIVFGGSNILKVKAGQESIILRSY